jgi:hypothetical protein
MSQAPAVAATPRAPMELWRQAGKMKTFAANAVAGVVRRNTALHKYRRRRANRMVSINVAQRLGDWRAEAVLHGALRRTWKKSVISATCQIFLPACPSFHGPAARGER